MSEKFTGDWSKRLPQDQREHVIKYGHHLGNGNPVKDSYWAGYELNGKFYISLNGESDAVWETSEEEMENHCL
jgi:hypothetical protein